MHGSREYGIPALNRIPISVCFGRCGDVVARLAPKNESGPIHPGSNTLHESDDLRNSDASFRVCPYTASEQRGERQAFLSTKQAHLVWLRSSSTGVFGKDLDWKRDIDYHVHHASFQHLRISAESGQRTHGSSHSQWVGTLFECPSDINDSLLVGCRDILGVMLCAYNGMYASKYSSLQPLLARSRGEHDATWLRWIVYKGLRHLAACGPSQITQTSLSPGSHSSRST